MSLKTPAETLCTPKYTLGLVLYFRDLQVHEICLKEVLQGHLSHEVNIYRVSMLQARFSCFVYIDPNPHKVVVLASQIPWMFLNTWVLSRINRRNS